MKKPVDRHPSPGPAEPDAASAEVAVAFQPRNELEQALMEAATDPAKRPAFQRAVLLAELYAVTPEAPAEDNGRILNAGESLALVNVPGPDGKPVAAVFTSLERIAEALGPGLGYLRMRGDALFEIIARRGGVFLNPGHPFRVHWGPADIAAMLDRNA
jgi:hypothetical protein